MKRNKCTWKVSLFVHEAPKLMMFFKRAFLLLFEQETIRELHKKACEIFSLNPELVRGSIDIPFWAFYGSWKKLCFFHFCSLNPFYPFQVCIWDYFSHQKHALMDMEKTLDDANIQMDQDVCFCMLQLILLRLLSLPQRNQLRI